MFLPNTTTSFQAQLLKALGLDFSTVFLAFKALAAAKNQAKSQATDATSVESGIDLVSYRVPDGALAFTTVGIDGTRYKDGSDSTSEGSPELLKWTRPSIRDDGSEAIAVNFAFGDGFSAPGIKKGRAKALIRKALQTWAQYAPLDFEELKYSSEQPDSVIDILIDSADLDGPGKTLAEAFFPKVGDITFDLNETWTDEKFVETALHEIGHALGLDHEDDTDAILNSRIANRFTNANKPFLLADDIAGIRNLYGEGMGSVTTLDGKQLIVLPPDSKPGSKTVDGTPSVARELGPDIAVNGSFENIPLDDQESSLYSRITGWQVTTGIGFRIDKRTELMGDAAEGTAWAALDILESNSTIAQNIDTLTGQAYELSVDYSNGGAEQVTAGIDVYWEGEKVDSLTGGGKGQWKRFAFEVTGGDRDASTLAFRATGPADDISGLIDNIAIRALKTTTQTATLQANESSAQTMSLGTTSAQNSTGQNSTGQNSTGLPSAETTNPNIGPGLGSSIGLGSRLLPNSASLV